MAKNKNLYDAASIGTEDSRTFCRRVPSTYLGSSKTNTNLIKEVFANCVDEVVIGHGDVINVTIDTENNIYSIEDFGQGFLINEPGIDKSTGQPMTDGKTILQRCFDTLNTSGKTSEDGVYEGTSLGLNGIGAKLTNWLSLKLNVITHRDGQFEEITFKDGLFVKRKVGKSKRVPGTIVTWSPDPQFFAVNEPDMVMLKSHFEVIAALCPQLTINLDYNGEKITYKEPGGINSYVEKKVSGKELFSNRFMIERSIGKDTLNICMTYTSDYSENIDSYVNYGHTDSGAHIQAFHTAFTRAVNKYATDVGLLKKNDRNFNNAEIGEGLYVVFNMITTTAKYDAQNKSRIDDIDAKIINSVIGGDFATWLMNNPSDAKIITERALNARKAREAAQKAKEKIRDAANGKGAKSLFVDLPTKLSDAYPKNKKDRSNCELIICLKGDTKIKLLNGTSPTIESLVGQTNLWAYSTDNTGTMIPAKIKDVFKTQDVTDMIKLTFSDGSVVECTPEHKFLDRDTCSWIEAKDLVIGQSMFSMKFKTSETANTKDIPLVWIPANGEKWSRGKWEPVHQRVANYLNISHKFNGTYMNIHHKDSNKFNNDPSNLEYITNKNHLAIHNRINHDSGKMNYENKHFTDESRINMQTAVYRRSKDGIDRQRKAVSAAWADGKYANATWKNYNETNRFINSKDKTQINKVLKLIKSMLDNNIEVTKDNYNEYRKITNNKVVALYDKALSYFDSFEHMIESANNYNLKITNIEYITYTEAIPVYCLNIDNPFHSFVLDNGIITHNCEGDSAVSSINAVKNSEFQASYPIRGKILNCQKATPDKVYGNAEIANITKALGLDIDKTTGKLIYNEKKLRYSKIIIACFTGDTKVKALDGKSYTFKELVDSNVNSLWVYSMDNHGNVVPGLAKDIRIVNTTNELLEITLDNEEVIKCTPDHYFLTAEGNYVMAKDLNVEDSLMPLYIKESTDGHLLYFNRNTGNYDKVHTMVAMNVLSNEYKDALYRLSIEDHLPHQNSVVVHHKNVLDSNNKTNNDPNNLEWLTNKEHFKLHGSYGYTAYNVSDKHKNRISELHKQGKYKNNNWRDNGYNGSEKHINDIKQAAKRGSYDHGWDHWNFSNEHKDVISNVNKSDIHILSVKRSYVGKTLKFLEINNIPFDEINYNFYRTRNAVRYSQLNELFSSMNELMEYYNSREFSLDVYNPLYDFNDYTKKEQCKQSIAFAIKQLLNRNLVFNEENYDNIAEYLETRAARVRVIPYRYITKFYDSYDEAYNAGCYYNHSIKSIKRIKVENEPVYCMNVEKYHNFALDSGVFVKNCDEDTDGYAISSLLLTVFNWLCPELIENGHIYRVHGALFKATFNDKSYILFQTENELELWKKTNTKAYTLSRAKGLGELTKDETYEQLVNPVTRNLHRLVTDNMEEFNKYLEMFEGTDVNARRDYLEDHFNDYDD